MAFAPLRLLQLDERQDFAIAKHIVSIHQYGSLAGNETEPDFSVTQLQLYIKCDTTPDPPGICPHCPVAQL